MKRYKIRKFSEFEARRLSYNYRKILEILRGYDSQMVRFTAQSLYDYADMKIIGEQHTPNSR